MPLTHQMSPAVIGPVKLKAVFKIQASNAEQLEWTLIIFG